jgi:PAS domain S-box-containing protein
MADARPSVTDATAGPAATILERLGHVASDTIVITDVAGRVTWISASVEAMSGYAPAELVGWPVAELYPGGIEEARRIMRRLRAGAPLRDYLTTFPARVGRAIGVRCAMALLHDDRGVVTGTVGVLKILT